MTVPTGFISLRRIRSFSLRMTRSHSLQTGRSFDRFAPSEWKKCSGVSGKVSSQVAQVLVAPMGAW